MRAFVESLRRIYISEYGDPSRDLAPIIYENKKVSKIKMKALLDANKITQEEFNYIGSGAINGEYPEDKEWVEEDRVKPMPETTEVLPLPEGDQQEGEKEVPSDPSSVEGDK